MTRKLLRRPGKRRYKRGNTSGQSGAKPERESGFKKECAKSGPMDLGENGSSKETEEQTVKV